jgi:hypothetical protein
MGIETKEEPMLNPDKTAANVAIIQNCYALFGQGDIPALIAQMTDDIVWEPVGDRNLFPLFGPWVGKDGVVAFFKTLSETQEFSAFEPKQFHAADDKVFVTGHYALTMRKSGVATECDWTMVFTLRGGLVCGFREYTDGARLVAAYRGAEASNLATVQQVYAEFAAGNVEAILGRLDPAVEWISGGSRDDFPTLGARKGIEGAASFFKDVAEYDQFSSFEPRQLVAMGDMVVALGHYGITAKQTGKHFESDWVHAFTIKAGKCVKFQEFTDTAAFYKAGRP